MADESYDVVVIGSGPGGLSAAALLQKRGLNCLLLEKNNLLGGKMISIDKDGYAYDLFPHGQVPMRGSAFEAIFEELGVSDEFVPALEPDDPRDVITLCYRRKDWDEYRKVTQKQQMADAEPLFDDVGHRRRGEGSCHQRHDRDGHHVRRGDGEARRDHDEGVARPAQYARRPVPTTSAFTPTLRSPSPSTLWRPPSRS